MMSRPFVFLCAVALAGCASVEPCGSSVPAEKDPVRVGVYVGPGARGSGVCHWVSLMALSPDVAPSYVDERTIAEGALDALDVLVMPGGLATVECKALKSTGADEKLVSFIRRGGGYVGTCAGCNLILNEPRYLRLAPYDHPSAIGHGTGLLALKFNDRAEALCGIRACTRLVRYSGGPVMRPGKPVAGASFETVATYDCDLVAEYGTNTTVGAMRGGAAAICGTYGRGRLFAFAAHPEYRSDTLDLIQGAFRYVTGRDVRFVRRQRASGDLCVAVYASGMGGIPDAEMVAALATANGIDVVYANLKEELGVGLLDHADALVLPAGYADAYGKKFNPRTAEFFERFARGGGKVFACGAALRRAPAGAIPCASAKNLVERVLEL